MAGTTACSGLTVTFDANDGSDDTVSAVGLSDNSAFTFSVPAEAATNPSGLYYLEITDGNCVAGGPTYQIDPGTSTEWESPAKPPAGSVTANTSIGNASPPLQGSVTYNGTIENGGSEAWYALYKKPDTNAASIRVENTTVAGTTACSGLTVTFDANDGSG